MGKTNRKINSSLSVWFLLSSCFVCDDHSWLDCVSCHCKGALGWWKVDFATKDPYWSGDWYTMLEGLQQSLNMVVYLSIIFGKSFSIVVFRFCDFCPNHGSLYLTIYIWWGEIIFESKNCTRDKKDWSVEMEDGILWVEMNV